MPFGTSAAAVRTVSGIVHLKGAIATTGTNPVPFTLPSAFRPPKRCLSLSTCATPPTGCSRSIRPGS